MLAALGESFGSAATWTVPSGGMYIWVTMPEGTDASAAHSVALDAGVAYQPGHIFAPDGVSGKNCFRLTFGYNSLEEIHDGIGLLAEVFTREGVFAS
jgi:DNA-binding transcriptional MocR family regulator